jgi:hypothetical protein
MQVIGCTDASRPSRPWIDIPLQFNQFQLKESPRSPLKPRAHRLRLGISTLFHQRWPLTMAKPWLSDVPPGEKT